MQEAIVCPICNDVITPNKNWDFTDGETRTLCCTNGHDLLVIIERPIIYNVYSSNDAIDMGIL